MRQLKTVTSALLATVILTGAALAAEVGVVDMQTVSQKYTKAQALSTQVKSKEEELQKLREKLLTELKAGEKLSPVEKKNLEDKLNAQFASKFKEYRQWTMDQEAALKVDFDKAIMQVSQKQHLDLVLPKQSVITGGKDITDDVVNVLNSTN